jgi:hypothetical protein
MNTINPLFNIGDQVYVTVDPYIFKHEATIIGNRLRYKGQNVYEIEANDQKNSFWKSIKGIAESNLTLIQ